MASPVFKTAWALLRAPEGSTPFLFRQFAMSGGHQLVISVPPPCVACVLVNLTDLRLQQQHSSRGQ